MKQTAKCAVMTGVNLPLEIRQYPLTPARDGLVQLSLEASGICGTDLHILRGKLGASLPAAIGHEFVGRITDITPADSAAYNLHPGDTAIVDIACPCGKCPLCLAGDDANCLHMGVTNGGDPDTAPHFYGGYGEYCYAPPANLVRVPDSLDPRMVSVFACAGPTSLHAFSLARQAGVDPASIRSAVVQGLGPVGCFAILYLAALGVPDIIAITGHPNETRADYARRCGATEVMDYATLGEEAVLARIRERTGIGADLVFEASGNPAAFAQGLQMLRNRGCYLVPGQYSNSGSVSIPPQLITFAALHIIGSSQYSLRDVENYLAFLESHPALHATVSAAAQAYPVSAVNCALRDAGKNVKTILIR